MGNNCQIATQQAHVLKELCTEPYSLPRKTDVPDPQICVNVSAVLCFRHAL